MARRQTKTREQRIGEIAFALKDIRETLDIWRDDKPADDPYIRKLYGEFDDLLAERDTLTAAA